MPARRLPKTLAPWREVLDTAEHESWFPLIFDRARPAEAAAMDELVASGEVMQTHDMIAAQLKDLVRSRTPSKNYTDDEVALETAALLGGQTEQEYGRWAFFPWSRRLVHLLPPAEYAEVRSDRNRNKITAQEQGKLQRLTIGIVGLSVGNAIAVTLALEGLFGELRLADFDTLDLSNMNRLRCTVDQIGLNKAVICARQIFEMNPYAVVTIFTEGLTVDNVGAFFDDGGPLDIAIDECDSIHVKFKLREEARARKIPVLMETSDRGMLDIERFDLEPHRPLLHGLVGDMTADVVATLPPPARVGLILKIIGESSMSPRLAASFLEFGRTLRGFAQLGSDVTLGGATAATAVRRLGLGAPLASGRVYIDLAALLGDVQAPPVRPDIALVNGAAREREFVRALVEQAVMAPSDGNMQPWRFTWSSDVLHVYRDPERSGGPADEFGRSTALVAVGAALENISIAAAAKGKDAQIDLFPVALEPDLAAKVTFKARAEGPVEDPLYQQIPRRCTNRRASTRLTLNQMHVQVLMEAARQQGVRLQLCQDRGNLAQIGQLLGETDRIQLLAPKLHDDYFERIRWSLDEVQGRRDGLDVAALELGPGTDLFLKVLSQPTVATMLNRVNGGSLFASTAAQAVAGSAALGLLTIEGTTPSSLVRGGRAMQHLWLTATALGLAVQPWNSAIHLFARVERYQGAKLGREEVQVLTDLRDQFMRHFTVSLSDTEIVLFRLGYTEPPPTRSLRRSLESVFSFKA